MLQPALHGKEHAGPTLAIVVGGGKALGRLTRAYLGDIDQRPSVLQWFEGHGDGRLVGNEGLAFGRIVSSAPVEDDLPVRHHFDHAHRERTGEVGEVPAY